LEGATVFAKRFYAPVLISPHVDGDNLNLFVVSDLPQPVKATMNVELSDLEGNKLATYNKT
jgi:beta-mannosidase